MKACIAKLTEEHEFYDKDRAKECFNHKPVVLVKLAGLYLQLDYDIRADPDLATNWNIACSWSESSRYRTASQGEASVLIEAISDPSHGVLAWIKNHW